MEKKRILVVDDDEVFLRLVEHDLSAAGYSIITAKNGGEALEFVKIQRPDLILLDIHMPEVDGGDVGQALKNKPQTKNIPVIYLTSLVTKEEEEQIGHEIRGNVFMAKPYNLGELLEQIRKRI